MPNTRVLDVTGSNGSSVLDHTKDKKLQSIKYQVKISEFTWYFFLFHKNEKTMLSDIFVIFLLKRSTVSIMKKENCATIIYRGNQTTGTF